MSLVKELENVRLVRTGPSLSERLERRIAGAHHGRVVSQLCKLREQLEVEMSPEPLGALTVSAVVLLSDVCRALGLDESETAQVLGVKGAAVLACEMAAVQGVINRRQVEALDVARKHGNITLGTFRAVCPGWSDEALRLDLADLVKRGLLVKNGDRKSTSYTLPV